MITFLFLFFLLFFFPFLAEPQNGQQNWGPDFDNACRASQSVNETIAAGHAKHVFDDFEDVMGESASARRRRA